jgi:hypothetical protein
MWHNETGITIHFDVGDYISLSVPEGSDGFVLQNADKPTLSTLYDLVQKRIVNDKIQISVDSDNKACAKLDEFYRI